MKFQKDQFQKSHRHRLLDCSASAPILHSQVPIANGSDRKSAADGIVPYNYAQVKPRIIVNGYVYACHRYIIIQKLIYCQKRSKSIVPDDNMKKPRSRKASCSTVYTRPASINGGHRRNVRRSYYRQSCLLRTNVGQGGLSSKRFAMIQDHDHDHMHDDDDDDGLRIQINPSQPTTTTATVQENNNISPWRESARKMCHELGDICEEAFNPRRMNHDDDDEYITALPVSSKSWYNINTEEEKKKRTWTWWTSNKHSSSHNRQKLTKRKSAAAAAQKESLDAPRKEKGGIFYIFHNSNDRVPKFKENSEPRHAATLGSNPAAIPVKLQNAEQSLSNQSICCRRYHHTRNQSRR